MIPSLVDLEAHGEAREPESVARDWLSVAADAVEVIAAEGADAAMLRFNTDISAGPADG